MKASAVLTSARPVARRALRVEASSKHAFSEREEIGEYRVEIGESSLRDLVDKRESLVASQKSEVRSPEAMPENEIKMNNTIMPSPLAFSFCSLRPMTIE